MRETFFDDELSEDDICDEETYDPNKTGMDKINRLILPLLRSYPEAFREVSDFVIQNFNQLFVPYAHHDTTSLLLKEFIPLMSDDVLLRLAIGVNQLARQSKYFSQRMA